MGVTVFSVPSPTARLWPGFDLWAISDKAAPKPVGLLFGDPLRYDNFIETEGIASPGLRNHMESS
jgi:hypothetical protein